MIVTWKNGPKYVLDPLTSQMFSILLTMTGTLLTVYQIAQ